MTEPLFPSLADPDGREAIRIGDDALSYRELAGAAAAIAHELEDAGRVAVWAQPTLELAVAVVGALAAGVAVVPINPGLGPRELGHIVQDSAPERLLAWPGVDPPAELQRLPRTDVDIKATRGREPHPEHRGDDDDVAFVMYTSGTTGPPKGVQIPRRAITTTSTRSPTSGSGRPRTASPTRCRCSTSTGS